MIEAKAAEEAVVAEAEVTQVLAKEEIEIMENNLKGN